MGCLRSPALSIFLFFLLLSLSMGAQELEKKPSVYVIPLRENIDRQLGVFFERSLEKAKTAGAEVVIIEIDTFGGRVDTALEIASKIGAASWVQTVAYVPADSGGRGVSWSAGALIAFSCDELWMAPGTSLGAAAPVYQSTEGIQAAEEKTVSAVRGQMAALAEKNGYPVAIALAMVDADVLLKEIIQDEQSTLMTQTDWEVLERRGESFLIGRTISEEGKLLTLTAGEAERYAVSNGSPSTQEALIEILGYPEATVVALEKSQSDSIMTLLTSSVMTSLLLIAGMIGLYLEITSPGFGLPGTLALICFAVVFGASGLMGNLGSTEIVLFLLGVVLLCVEIFLIPGFGVTGILGIMLILISLVLSQQDFYWPQYTWQWSLVRRNIVLVGSGLLGGIFFIGLLMIFLPRSSFFHRLILFNPGEKNQDLMPAARNKHRGSDRKEISRENGEKAASFSKDIPIGVEGLAMTDLKPVGKIRVQGKIFVAETSGEYYKKGTVVKIHDYDGIRIIVTAKESV